MGPTGGKRLYTADRREAKKLIPADVTMAQNHEPTSQKPLRLWPGVVIAILQCLVRFGVRVVVPEATLVGVLAGPGGAVGLGLWWGFFSRGPWSERLGAVGLVVAPRFSPLRGMP